MENSASIKERQIGNVRIRYIHEAKPDAPVYCDGEEERRLYENFLKNNKYTDFATEEKFSSWVEEYHLSPVRQNLLKWIPFNPEGSVLEVGAGCGALTGILSQKLKKVTALEYSEQRAMITAMRHQQFRNLEVIVGGLQDFVCDEKFDYVTVIGVLEYAGRFYEGNDPYKSFLVKLRTLLKPDGVLILAIENRIGVKYLCGAEEDHTGRVFESIYNYPSSSGVRTFSRKELSDILKESGFQSLEWYYPFPDYKLPQQIISDDASARDLDSVREIFPNGSSNKRTMSEKRLAKTLMHAGLFNEFANSFLVFVRMQDARETSKCIHFFGTNMNRKRKFRTYKKIIRDGAEKTFVLSPDNDEAAGFIQEIVRNGTLAKKYFGDIAETVTGELRGTSLYYPYIAYPTMLELLRRQISEGDTGFGRSLIDRYIEFLSKLPSRTCVPNRFMEELGLSGRENQEPVNCLDCAIIDCVPRNIMVDLNKDKYCIIDNEFIYDFPLPADFLKWCAINTLVIDLQDDIQSQVDQSRPVTIFSGHGVNRYFVPLSWISIFDSIVIPRKKLIHWYELWQRKVLIGRTKTYLRLKSVNRAVHRLIAGDIAVRNNAVESIYYILHKARRLL